MSKGVIKFSNKTGSSVNYADREISTETGLSLSVYLSGNRVDLARADLSNVIPGAVKAQIANELQSIASELLELHNDVAETNAAVVTKSNRMVGVVPPYPSNGLLTVTGSSRITINAFNYFNGQEVTTYDTTSIDIGNSWSGKVAYIGLDATGAGTLFSSEYEPWLMLGSIFVNSDSTISAAELVTKPYLADSGPFGRDHPIMVNGLELSISPTKTVTLSNCSMQDEGISYTNLDHPNLKLFPQRFDVPFKYYYRGWNFDAENPVTTFSAKYYNTDLGTTVSVDTSLGTSRYVVYRAVIIETGQLLMQCQEVKSVNELFSSVDEANAGIANIQWNLSGLSSRAIYLDQYVIVSADGTIVERAKISTGLSTEYTIINALLAGIVQGPAEPIANVTQWVAAFGDSNQPVKNSIYAITEPIDTGGYLIRLMVVTNVAPDGTITYDGALSEGIYNKAAIDALLSGHSSSDTFKTQLLLNNVVESGNLETEDSELARTQLVLNNILGG